MNWIDLCTVIMLVLGTATGIRKGLVASVTSIACIIISIVAAKTYYKTVTLFLLDNTPLKDTIIKFMQEKKVLQGFTDFMPGSARTVFHSDYFIQDIHTLVSIAMINILSIIGIYIVARLLLSFIEGYIKSVASLPGVNEINRLGGGAVGLSKTVLLLLLVFAAVIPLVNILPWPAVKEAVQSSTLAGYFYSYNFILGWIWNSALELIKR
jgi:uncharacterized membrane protein required for colicin V production